MGEHAGGSRPLTVPGPAAAQDGGAAAAAAGGGQPVSGGVTAGTLGCGDTQQCPHWPGVSPGGSPVVWPSPPRSRSSEHSTLPSLSMSRTM